MKPSLESSIVNLKLKVHTDFLDKTILSLRSRRPFVDVDLTHTIYRSGHVLFVWVQTPPCQFSICGKCSVCDYWKGTYAPSSVAAVCDYISSSVIEEDTILLNTCGSVLDGRELPFDELLKIIEAIAKLDIKALILETHLAFVSIDKIKRITDILGDRKLFIEYGQESTNIDVLTWCLNKPSMLNEYSVLYDLKEMGVGTLANIILGTPFLNVHERIADSVRSIRELLSKPIAGVVLFPVNIKQYTLIQYLYDNGYYKQVNALEIIEVLKCFDETELGKIDLAWFEPRPQNNTAYTDPIIGPSYCENCGDEILLSFLQYNATACGKRRKKIIEHISNLECSCKDDLFNYHIPDINGCYSFLSKTLFQEVLE